MKTIALAMAAAFVCMTPTIAAANEKPPITINNCAMGYETTGDETVIGHGVAFTNTSHHVITAVRFNFTYLSAFNDVLGGALETDVGSFAPGAVIDHTKKDLGKQLFGRQAFFGAATATPLVNYRWQSANNTHETIEHLKPSCAIDAISFQDGTVWTAPK
jgi:opacity protein-like surface antigen